MRPLHEAGSDAPRAGALGSCDPSTSVALLARCALRTFAVARLVRYLESAGAAAEWDAAAPSRIRAAAPVAEQAAAPAGRRNEEDAMDVFETMTARYSARSYKTDAVEDDKLARILEAARLAPTAANRQPFRLVVARTAGREEEMARIYSDRRPLWFTVAPLVLAIVAVPAEAWRRLDGKSYHEVDASIVMDHVVLAATALGLGTCWIAAFDPAAAREVLGLPDDVEPIAFTPLGYAADAPGQKKRRPLDELVKYDHW